MLTTREAQTSNIDRANATVSNTTAVPKDGNSTKKADVDRFECSRNCPPRDGVPMYGCDPSSEAQFLAQKNERDRLDKADKPSSGEKALSIAAAVVQFVVSVVATSMGLAVGTGGGSAVGGAAAGGAAAGGSPLSGLASALGGLFGAIDGKEPTKEDEDKRP